MNNWKKMMNEKEWRKWRGSWMRKKEEDKDKEEEGGKWGRKSEEE